MTIVRKWDEDKAIVLDNVLSVEYEKDYPNSTYLIIFLMKGGEKIIWAYKSISTAERQFQSFLSKPK